MAAAEVINHAPWDLPQPKDVVRSPSFHLPIPPQPAKHDKKRSRKKKENPTLESHHSVTTRPDEQKPKGSKKVENASPRRWNWTSLIDKTVSLHPPVFTKDRRLVTVTIVLVFHLYTFQ